MDLNQLLVIYIKVLMEMIYTIQLKKKHLISYIWFLRIISFVDDNKRIAATLFIYFLSFYGILKIDNDQVIDNNTLTAITLLIAESSPKEKDIIIDLIMNFLIR